METWRKFPITCFSVYWAKFFPSLLWNKDRRVTPGPWKQASKYNITILLPSDSTDVLAVCAGGPFNSRHRVRWEYVCFFPCMTVGEMGGCMLLPAAQRQRWGKGTILLWQCYLLMSPNLPLGIILCHSGAGAASTIDWMLSYLDNIQFTVHYPLPISVFNVKKGPRKKR